MSDTIFAPRIVSIGESGKIDIDEVKMVVFDLPVYEWIQSMNTQFNEILKNKRIILDPCTDNLFIDPTKRSQTTVNYLGFSSNIKQKLINGEVILYTNFEDKEIEEYTLNCLERQNKLHASILISPYVPVVSVDHDAYEYQKKFWKIASDFNSSDLPEIFGVVCHNSSLFTNKRYKNTFLNDIKDLNLDGIALYIYSFDEYNASVKELEGLIKLIIEIKKQGKKVMIFYTSSFGLVLSIFGTDIISSGACYMTSRAKAETRPEGGGMEITDSRRRYYVRPILCKVIVTSIEEVLREVNYYCTCENCQLWLIPHPQVNLMQEKGSLTDLAKHFLIERISELSDINKWKKEGTSLQNVSSMLLNAIDFVTKIKAMGIDLGIRNADPSKFLENWHQALSNCEELI